MTDERRNGERRKSPAFSIYPKDWLGSADIMLMPPESEGLYIRLLMVAWDNHGLPTDEAAVKELAGRKYSRIWRTCWPPVRAKFVEIDGRLVNARQEDERAKQTARAKQRTDAANERWEKERLKAV